MKIALIPCGDTEWRQEGRWLGRVELPLTSAGETAVEAWAELLRPLGLPKLYHAPDELASRTAELVAEALGVPRKAVAELEEVNIGLWTGLTEQQLEARFETCWRELREQPLHVIPPNGEGFAHATERLRRAVQKTLRRNGKVAAGFVLRPLALALLQATLEGREPGDLSEAYAVSQPVIVDADAAAMVKS